MSKRSVKILLFVSISIIAVFAAALFGAESVLAPKIKKMVEERASEALGSPVKVERVHIEIFPPLSASLFHLKTLIKDETTVLSIDLSKVDIKIDLMSLWSRKYVLDVTLDAPIITYSLPDANDEGKVVSPEKKKPTASVADTIPSEPLDLTVSVFVTNGLVNVLKDMKTYVALKNLNATLGHFQMGKAGTLNSKFVFESHINPMAEFSLPTEIDSQFVATTQSFESKQSALKIGGIEAKMSGASDLKSESHLWQIDMDVKDLSALKGLPELLSKMKLTGSLESKISIQKKSGLDWRAKGDLKAKKVSGDSDFKKDNMVFKGPFHIDLDTEFSFNKTLIIQRFILEAEATNAQIDVPGQLIKPSGTTLKASISANQSDNKVVIDKGEIEFATFKGQVKGTHTAAETNLDFIIEKTNLSGFEKFFPVISQAPLVGQIEAKGHIEGDVSNPKSLFIKLQPLHLDNLQASVSYLSEDKKKKVIGLIKANSKIQLDLNKGQLQTANVVGDFDFTQLQIIWDDLFEKKAGELLSASVQAGQNKNILEIKKFSLNTPFTLASTKGSIKNFEEPQFDLDLSVSKMNLKNLIEHFPKYSHFAIQGTAQSDLHIKGKYNFKDGIEKSQISLQGYANVVIPQFVTKTPPQAAGSGDKKSTPTEKTEAELKAEREPMLPNWPIFRNSAVKLNVQVGRFQKDKLVAQKIDFKGFFSQGTLMGQGSIKNLFNGELIFSQLSLPLLAPQPSTQLTVQTKQLDVQKFLEWGMPTYKEAASGLASGTVHMKIAHPSRKDFVQATTANGKVTLTNGFLSTLQFDVMAREKLAQVPGLGDKAKQFTTKGAQANIYMDFDFQKGDLNLRRLQVVTPEKNELLVAGVVKSADQTMDLRGQSFLKDAPVSGPVREHNSDPQGRLIVPVHFDGSIFKPNLHLADETLKEMLSRTASGETNKFKKQAEAKVKAEGQKVIDQQKVKLQEEAKKALKGILGN